MKILSLLLGTDEEKKKDDTSIFNLFGLDENEKENLVEDDYYYEDEY